MKVHNQPGFLLHGRPYRESSMLLDVFTREHGRLMLIAKGCRRKKSRQQGVTMPFRPVILGWAGKGELPVLTAIEQNGYFKPLHSEILGCGYYMNELLMKLLHRHDPHALLFDKYHDAVSNLAAGADPYSELRIFEKYLLQEIGFGLVLDHDVDTGEAISADTGYYYHPEKGPVAADGADAHRVPGSTLIALRNEQFDNSEDQAAARRLTRAMLDSQLSGRTLRSRRVQRDIRRYAEKFSK